MQVFLLAYFSDNGYHKQRVWFPFIQVHMCLQCASFGGSYMLEALDWFPKADSQRLRMRGRVWRWVDSTTHFQIRVSYRFSRHQKRDDRIR